MSNELQTLNILISALEDTGQQIKLKDQNNRAYSFFKAKKDGGETVAYQNFKDYKIGDTVEINFREIPYKDATIRNILSIKPPTGQPHAEAVLSRGRKKPALSQQYWEQREAKRQNSIVLQVAFKAAVEFQSANVRSGSKLDKDRLYQDTLEFYDWIISQVGDGASAQAASNEDDAERAF